ncbi:hypothetical protein [Microbacterium sp. KRD172]|uniref:hypothetical protein n=1 Tax=Microbacterium sp. KRD172 TaxID=2729727 RepID=UPI0019D1ED9A|nr:hypothetical protein [Microbacterium sp. KRD172]
MSSSNEMPDLDLPARAVGDSPRTDPLLEALVGRPRQESRPHSEGADAVRLVNLVDSAVVNSSPSVIFVSSQKSKRPKKHRGHRRIDWVNTIVGAVAVVVVAATAVFTGVQVASADPASDAVEVLAADEASLAGAENSLAVSTARLEESIATGLEDSAIVRAALGELAATAERAETADPAALAAAVQAVDVYRTGLEQTVVPPAPAPYERGNIDEDSLTSVADAINKVQEASTAVDEASDALRTYRTSVDALNTAYTGQLAAFAGSLTAYATAQNDAYPVAGQEFRDAVTTAATTVAATPLNGASATSALKTFRDAVLALREEDLRVRVLEEQEREQSQNNQQPVTPTPEPDETQTDPTQTNPDQTDPAPVDPTPTDPPASTDPTGSGDGGGLFEG